MSSIANHQISPVDKTGDGVHLISTTAQVISAVDQIDDVGPQTSDVHETSVGTKAFHVDHAAHGRKNEDQLNDALGKMNKLFNSMCRDLQTIRRELRNTRREVTSMNKKFETAIPKTDIAKTISVNSLTVNTNLI